MIDVFICTYNPNEDYLKRTVDSINAQNLNKSKWTLTIIDNNSKSPVADIHFVQAMGIKVIIEKKQGLTAARACATYAAKGNIIVFVDDDNVLDINYLSLVEDTLNDEIIGVISGAVFPEYIKTPDKWFYTFESALAIKRIYGDKLIINKENYYNELFPIGAGMSIRRNLAEDYYTKHMSGINYIEDRKGDELSSGGDLDLDFYVLSRGYKIGINPLMKIIHIIPENRTTINYINKLCVSSVKSSFLLDKKWHLVFGHHVFDIFEMKTNVIRIKIIYNYLLGIFNKSKYIRYSLLKALLSIS